MSCTYLKDVQGENSRGSEDLPKKQKVEKIVMGFALVYDGFMNFVGIQLPRNC